MRLVGAALFLLCVAGAIARAADPAADADSNAPATSSNPPPPAVLPDHPDLNQPVPPAGTLVLHPAPAATETPESAVPPPSSPQFAYPQGLPEDLPDHLLVVYNSSYPDSKSLATYYARRRNIPPERVLGITCSSAEEISRPEYETTIREPIIAYIYKQGWMTRRSTMARVGNVTRELLVATHNDIWAMVLMRGMPLKIAHDPTDTTSLATQPELQTNAAAVDSELALLPIFGLPKGGFIPNVFYDAAATGLIRAGPELATHLILVTRLDGPRASDVRRMIDDSLYAEQHRLAGLAVIDTRGLEDAGNAYTMGDAWLRSSRSMLHDDGWLVKFDSAPDVLPASDPLNHVAFYLGWYTVTATGPWVTPPNRFERGAIAYHLHSGSANTLRSLTDNWAGPLIAHGAAATMGCVYEPYLDLTPHLNIFTRRLLDGDYFAEAAYASQRGLSWMVTVVGDPLYRPFAQPLQSAIALAGSPTSDHYDWLLVQQIQREIARGEIDDSISTLKQYLNVPGAVAQEGLGDLLENVPHDSGAIFAAADAYRNASSLETLPIDRIRVGLKLAQIYENIGEAGRAQAELSSLRDLYPEDAARFGVTDSLVPAGGYPRALPLDLHSLAPVRAHTAVQSATLPKPPGPPKPY